MLFGYVSMPAWGAECSAVLAVVWACECAYDGAVCSVQAHAHPTANTAPQGVNCLNVL